MLNHILTSKPAPMPATAHVMNQSTVGVDLPAGDSGTTDLGSVGAAAQVESPPCATCQIPGAPAHDPMPRCHYRPHIVNHCTCSACF